MAEITLKKLPKKFQIKLERRAKAEGKSVEDYVLQVLEQQIHTEEVLKDLAKLRLKTAKYPLTPSILKRAKGRGRL